jgi:hypothetical protein
LLIFIDCVWVWIDELKVCTCALRESKRVSRLEWARPRSWKNGKTSNPIQTRRMTMSAADEVPAAREEYLANTREEENRTNTIQQTGVNLLSSFMKIEIDSQPRQIRDFLSAPSPLGARAQLPVATRQSIPSAQAWSSRGKTSCRTCGRRNPSLGKAEAPATFQSPEMIRCLMTAQKLVDRKCRPSVRLEAADRRPSERGFLRHPGAASTSPVVRRSGSERFPGSDAKLLRWCRIPVFPPPSFGRLTWKEIGLLF